jgi:hypothetical protein
VKVHAKELSNIKMVEGNEHTYNIVIDNGILKEWVAIGWIEVREATPEDFKRYPTVKRGEVSD